jgi:DNA primase
MTRGATKNDIDQLTSTVSLQRLAESKAVKLRPRKDGTLTGTCPFHTGSKSKTRPVLTLDAKANTWSCPACRTKSGTVVEWVMRAEGVSRKHALELLRQDFGSSTSKPSKRKAKDAPRLTTFSEAEEPDHVLMAKVLDYYADTLRQSPEAQQYLRDRKLVHGELLDRFRLGFSNRTLGYRIERKNRKHGFLLRRQLERIGIGRESGHEHFNGAVVFPVLDEHGQVQQVFGRKILGDTRLAKGTPLRLWLPGGPRGVFNVQTFTASTEIVICKGIVDALTLWCHGVRNVTATFQGFELHDDLREAIETHDVKRLLIAFDRNRDGDAAADKIAAEFSGKGIEVFRVQLPNGMDCNDYARSVEQPADALQQAVRSAVWLAGKARPATVVGQSQETRDAPASTTAISTPAVEPKVEQREEEIVLMFGDRRWRIRGLGKNTSYEAMKVNVLVGRDNGHPLGHGFHVDTLELYSARQRASFVKQASDELGVDEQVIKHDLGRVLMHLEQEQDRLIKAELEPAKPVVEMSAEDREQALRLLRDPRLLERISEDFGRCGLIGEGTNKLVAYLAATSRKLPDPLAIVVQSSSAAGKTSLMDAVLAFIPEEERMSFSAMTGQSLYYMGTMELAHRVLAISEEAGAKRSSYALKLLQSDGEISIASTAKDPGTGRLITQEYRVQGPVMLFMTTTSLDIDPELMNRCVVLAVDEGREQTAAIHAVQRQRQTLDGLLGRHDRDDITKLHRNAQRLLRSTNVVNPFAPELQFHSGSTRSRRDHAKYLNLIRTIALLHQHQRTTKVVEHRGHKVEFIEATQADVDLATKLAAEVLSGDELPPPTVKVLHVVRDFVQTKATEMDIAPSEVKFTQRDVRAHVGLGHSQMKVHLARLVELEHLVVHAGGPRRRTIYTYDANWPVPEASGRSLAGTTDRPDSSKGSVPVEDLAGRAAPARLGTKRKSASYSQAPSK